MVQYYMGLPSPAVFKLAISGIKEDSQLTLPLFDQQFMTLMKLRLHEFSIFV